MNDDPEQWRVQFDAEVTFANGGALQAQEFRLDAAGPDISDTELGELFVRHLGLLMVGEVSIRNKQMLREAHKGSRGTAGAENRSGTRIVDLSHALRHGNLTHPGSPALAAGDHVTPGIGLPAPHASIGGSTGTRLSGPFRRLADGADLAALPLSRLTDLEGMLVRVLGTAERPIERGLFLPYDITGKAVLIHTGWDRIGSTGRHGDGHPFLTADAAEWLAERQPALVGIDAPYIDDTNSNSNTNTNSGDSESDACPARSALLKAGVPVLEHLRGLDQLPPHGFRLHAAPLAAEGAVTLPVRAYALIGE